MIKCSNKQRLRSQQESRVAAASRTFHFLFFAEYFLEDCIQMTNFVPPPMDRKKKEKDEEGGEDDVSDLIPDGPIVVSESAAQCGAELCLSRLCRLTVI